MAPRVAQVGVEQQHSRTRLCECRGKIDAPHRLALGRPGTGHQDHLGRRLWYGEEDGGAEAAERLGDPGPRLPEDHQVAGAPGPSSPLLPFVAGPFASGMAGSPRAWRARAVARRASAKLGMTASVGSRSSPSTSWRLLTLWSKYSQPKAAPTASTSPASTPRVRSRGMFGLLACRGTSARSMTRTLEAASSEFTAVSICC